MNTNLNYTANEQSALNQNFLNSFLSQDSGLHKQAAEDLDTWLHWYQRQDGVFRRVLPPTPVTSADFAESVDSRDPFIIRTIMPNSLGANIVTWDTGTATASMYADKYMIFLQRIITPKYRIDKIYLTAYKGDLLAVFKDLMLQDILATEDYMGMQLLGAVIGTKHTVNTDIGIKQWVDGGLSITTESVMNGVSGLIYGSNNLNPSQALVHRSFWWKLISAFKADTQGDNLTENAILGKSGVLEESLAGISWKTVLDRNIVPINTMFVMAEPKYCGEFVTYEEANIFSKIDDNIWFEMFAHECAGMNIPYRGCATRVDYGEDNAESWTEEEVASSSSSSSGSSN